MRPRSRPASTCGLKRAPLVALALALGLTPLLGAGAVTTRTKPFARPPYYQGDPAPAGARIAHLAPVVATAPGIPDSWVPGTALARLAADIDRFVEAESLSLALLAGAGDGGNVGAPSVYFGCELDDVGDCDAQLRQNVLATSGGTRAWRERIVESQRAAGVSHVIVLELGLAPRWIHQKNLSGKKEVRLGSEHTQSLAWLASLDSPVWVLQLTGVLIDGEGKVTRSGAEGLWAVRTPFRASLLGAERLMSDDEVDHVRTELVREDLPGRPLIWQTATRRFFKELLAPGTKGP